MQEELCLLCVHAHPDDESSKGAGTVARYHSEGVRSVLVTCTCGEEGDILNPAMESPDVRANIREIRLEELKRATAIIGYDEVVLLGYRDSGMAETESNAHPDCFAMADFDEAVGRLVAVIRRTRPQVVVTYGDEQTRYPHPDHIRTHEISVVAFDKAGDPDAYPEAGEPYEPLKLYYSTWPRHLMIARHEKFIELGLESPFAERITKGWLETTREDEVTTRISLKGYEEVRRDALREHATQIDPTSPFWYGLPIEVERSIPHYDAFFLAKSRVGPALLDEEEDDLFSGVREYLEQVDETESADARSGA